MNGRPRGTFYDVRTVDVALPRLDPDSPAACPVPLEHVVEHVTTEFGDNTGGGRSAPSFLRTARIGATDYWIWSFHEPGCGAGYAVVALWPGGHALIECDGTFGMTPEQYVVAMHFQIEP